MAEHNAYGVLVGNDANLMDHLTRLHPRRAAAFIARQMANLLARSSDEMGPMRG
jgi:hypothetical protein